MQNTTSFSQTAAQTETKNPFPGLRPFLEEDSHLFFGRENQVGEVLEKLIQNNFIAIIGNSGIGKSSFINCGILPKLYADHPGVVSSQWDVITFRPGHDPILQLAKAFAKEIKGRNHPPKENITSNHVQSILKSNGHLGFSELVKNFIKSSGKNLLLFIDQFEEVFRFKPETEGVLDETTLFIDIIVKAAQNKDVPVFVVTTMRSDFIGECSKFPLLTSAINNSQFLIPQMTRDEKRAAIVGPCKVMGRNINESLVNEILNKVGDDADQLPVMQHSLMRTWDYWEENKIGNEDIDLNHYKAIGGMESALSVHANEIFNNLPQNLKHSCEKCFKSLTEKGEEGRSFRRPATIKELAEISQANTSDITAIVNEFRKPGRTILTPPFGTELEAGSIIDISHESLMRIWGTLTNWMEEEYESTKQYLRIAEAAELHQSGKGALLKSPELQMATNWYYQEKPTKAWGIRHHVAFDRTIEYLLFSEKQFLREQRLKTRQQKRRLFVARLIALIFGSGAVVAAILVVYAINKKKDADIQAEKADNQAKIAKEKSVLAEEKTKEAVASAKEAQKQTDKAKASAAEAKRQSKIAEQKKQEALRQQVIADSARHKAVLEEEKALRMRMLSIARSMAIKSLQEPELTTKSLVSRQAYNFYFDNGGQGTDPDIYNALYYSVKRMKGEKFNTLSGHTDNVRSIVTNSKNDLFFSASSDGRIFKWTHGGGLNFANELVSSDDEKVHMAMALSGDGKWLAVGGDYPYIMVFNLTNSKKKPERVQTGSMQTLFLDFTPDNKVVYAGTNKKLMIWDFVSQKEIGITKNKLNAIDVDPTGKYFATGLENGKVIIYELDNNFNSKVLYSENTGQAITSLKFSDNGRMMAIGTIKGQVRILDVSNGYVAASLSGHTARVNQICFNHADTKLATASFDHTVRIWDLANYYNQPVILDDHKDWVWSIAFSKDDDYLFAGCRDKLVRAWIMDIHTLSQDICKADTVDRNLTEKEWEHYVADDIEIECTCKKNCK